MGVGFEEEQGFVEEKEGLEGPRGTCDVDDSHAYLHGIQRGLLAGKDVDH
jgi:hypothetical protein